jgi:dTDP-4-dehydrorhamnose reductase
MARWLITGARGQLGSALKTALNGLDVVAVGREDMDITDEGAVLDVVQSVRPSIVVNAAAYTAVDNAETDGKRAFAVNAVGAGHVARACAATGSLLVHLSTDYVFSGDAHDPYPETAPAAPRTVYGQTKLAGEHAVAEALATHYIVRTAWLFGGGEGNFLTTMMRLERECETVSVVDDQTGSPTWSRDLASAILALATSGAPAGTYHCTNTGVTTWFGFAQAIFAELGADPRRVVPVATQSVPRRAPRPRYSVLDMSRWRSLGLPVPLRWQDAVHRAVAEIRPVRGSSP